MADLRCENSILFGKLEDEVLEVKCRSSRCGHNANTVVIHRFDIHTGTPLETRRYKNPQNRKVRT